MPCFIGKKLLATVASVKCPSDCNNCCNSYNCLTVNRQISLHTITQCTKTEEVFLSVFFSKTFLLHFFSPPRQDIASLTYPDGFRQTQTVWLHETRQNGLSALSQCCEERFLVRALSGNIIVHGEATFNAGRFAFHLFFL